MTTPDKRQVPVEICLSSNLWCRSVPSLEEHHVKLLHADGHPFCICTDDKSAFDTCLSQEYAMAQGALGLTNQQVFELSFQTIDMTFASDQVKEDLKDLWKKFWADWSKCSIIMSTQ